MLRGGFGVHDFHGLDLSVALSTVFGPVHRPGCFFSNSFFSLFGSSQVSGHHPRDKNYSDAPGKG